MHIKEDSGFENSANNFVGTDISQNSYSDEDRFFCRICHLTDEESTSYFSESKGGEWIHPCTCSGTMKWVHRGCMGTWLDSAPYQQRYQCTLCNYYYRLTWRIRPLIYWRFPRFNLTFWDKVEITFDVFYTYYAIRSVINVFTNQAKSLFRSVPFLASWYFFVANDRRFDFYRRLFIIFISTFLETTVRNAI